MDVRLRLSGAAAAAFLGLFIAQYIGFFLLGEGFAFGLGASSTRSLLWARTDPKLILGSARFYLRAGQGVDVTYKAELGGGGCLRFYLARFWPNDLMTFSNSVDVTADGDGASELVAPAAGWYRMSIYGARPFSCITTHTAFSQGVTGGVSYRMAWKVRPA